MREIFIEKKDSTTRIAIKEKGDLIECLVDENKNDPQIGEIYLGKVKKIVPSINSVFIDIGLNKEAYMYYSDEFKKNGIKKGDNILVEVVKDPVGNKSARVSEKVNIPGRYLVLTLGNEGIRFSKRITNNSNKEKLKSYITLSENIGVTIRTEAEQATEEEIKEELLKLMTISEGLKMKLNYSKNLGRLYGENSLLDKVIIDKIKDETKVFVNDVTLYNYILDKVNKKCIIKHFDNSTRELFDYFSIDKEIIKLRHKKVVLKCGGNIIIEKTEAMHVIDVNSSNNLKGRDFNKTILETNLEAAKEIGKQIMLRNLSGIIVIDFIDMREEHHKSLVYRELKEALKEDKGNVKILPFTELNLIQITRKRLGKSVYDYLEEDCKKCNGKGNVLRLSYIKNILRNEIVKCKYENSILDFYIELDEVYRDEVEGDKLTFLSDIEALEGEIYLKFVENIDGYKIEPIIFQKQKEGLENLKMKAYEKYL